MQTYSQTFAAPETWVLNIGGKYFVTLDIPTACNYRFYRQGQKLDLGDIAGLANGLEVGPLAELKEPNAFDRVEIDILAAGTYKVGIGNGAVRYNNAVANVTIASNRIAQTSGTQTTKTVTNASAVLVAANANRQSLLIQNKDTSGSIYLRFGAAAATVADGVEIGPKGFYEAGPIVDIQEIRAIGSIAFNANVIVVEG